MSDGDSIDEASGDVDPGDELLAVAPPTAQDVLGYPPCAVCGRDAVPMDQQEDGRLVCHECAQERRRPDLYDLISICVEFAAMPDSARADLVALRDVHFDDGIPDAGMIGVDVDAEHVDASSLRHIADLLGVTAKTFGNSVAGAEAAELAKACRDAR